MPFHRLKFSSQILRLLGEELNPSPDQGIIELVKNAYDADARKCTVELVGAHLPGGSIRVVDDGEGMSPEQIRDGWLIIGESRKTPRMKSAAGRMLVGSKGLGRLAALRLGRSATLVSRPKVPADKEYHLILDWDQYDSSAIVDDVELEIRETARTKPAPGIEILIEQVAEAWTQPAVERLARALMLLSDPFGQGAGFKTHLIAKGFERALTKVEKGVLDQADYHLVASIDENGQASAKVHGPSGSVVFTGTHAAVAGPEATAYRCPPMVFELWEFLLDPRRFTTKAVGFKETKTWLRHFGGVHVYYRNVRVSPYGDEGNDWLEMNLRRSQRQELRPSTNNSIGLVRLTDAQALFLQKTDRLGFIDNEPFRELVRFANDALEWMADEKSRARDRKKRETKVDLAANKTAVERLLEAAVQQLPPEQRKPVEQAIAAQRSVQQQEVDVLIDEKQLYQTLGTVGTTASAFAHQSRKPLQIIGNDVETLEDLLGDPSHASFPEVSAEIAKRIKAAADALLAFTSVTLKLLQHEKRRPGHQAIEARIGEIVDLLRPYFKFRHVEAQFEFHAGEAVQFYGSRAMFESIVTNLINNSLQAFVRGGKDDEAALEPPPKVKRVMLFRTEVTGDFIKLVVADNGPGIVGLPIADIWLPGKTTTHEGTGLGLTIVRDAVTDLGGQIEAAAQGTLGGAEFTILLPLSKSTS